MPTIRFAENLGCVGLGENIVRVDCSLLMYQFATSIQHMFTTEIFDFKNTLICFHKFDCTVRNYPFAILRHIQLPTELYEWLRTEILWLKKRSKAHDTYGHVMKYHTIIFRTCLVLLVKRNRSQVGWVTPTNAFVGTSKIEPKLGMIFSANERAPTEMLRKSYQEQNITWFYHEYC